MKTKSILRAILLALLLSTLNPQLSRLRLGYGAAGTAILLFSIFQLFSLSAFGQGSIVPTTAPTVPIMKTLQQVEPRTDLQAPTLPPGVTTDANYHFIINQPGSYYLSANLGVTKANGIRINTAGVTLDLNGFQISRSSGSGGAGILIFTTAHRCTVKDGLVTGFAYGVQALYGGGSPNGGTLLQVSVSNCSTDGILTGSSWLIERCNAFNNSGDGIVAGDGSTVTNCIAYLNQMVGIYAAEGSTLIGCTATRNQGTAPGISVNLGCTVTNCTATYNEGVGISALAGCTITNCTATRNHLSGISSSSGSTIKNCTAQENDGDGIVVSESCLVLNNHCDGNGFLTADGAGIHATGTESRIDGNKVSNNDRGIDVDDIRNFIIRNTARENAGMNYAIVAGNRVGAIVIPALSGDIAGDSDADAVGVSTTDPWANFTY